MDNHDAAPVQPATLSPEQSEALSSILRIPGALAAGFLGGLGLGAAQGSKMAGLRFRAEHAHRLPTSQKGWYFYHKTKNYHMMYGGIREGFKLGLRMAGWTGLFFGVEATMHNFRRKSDFMNSVVAGLSTAGCFSAKNRFPLPTTAHTTKIGLLVGLGLGLSQDFLHVLQGRRPWYINRIQARFTGSKAGAAFEDAA